MTTSSICSRPYQFGVHGAGPIGLGLIGMIASSNPKYSIVATTNNQLLEALINKHHNYQVYQPHPPQDLQPNPTSESVDTMNPLTLNESGDAEVVEAVDESSDMCSKNKPEDDNDSGSGSDNDSFPPYYLSPSLGAVSNNPSSSSSSSSTSNPDNSNRNSNPNVVTVSNISIIGRNQSDIIQLYNQSNIVAICLTPVAISDSANDIGKAILVRYMNHYGMKNYDDNDNNNDQSSIPAIPILPVMVLVNIPDSHEFVYDKVFPALLSLTNDNHALCKRVISSIHFIQTVIDRVVTRVDTKTIIDHIIQQMVNLRYQNPQTFFMQYQQWLQRNINSMTKHQSNGNTMNGGGQNKPNLSHHHFSPLHVCQDMTCSQLIHYLTLLFHVRNSNDDPLNLDIPPSLLFAISIFDVYCPCLFQAEYYYSAHASPFELSIEFPDIKIVDNIKIFDDLKNKLINGPHAILAWLGAIKGYQYIYQVLNDKEIYDYINDLIDNTIIRVIRINYPTMISYDKLIEMKKTFLLRCQILKNDTTIRVGRDPLRKLNAGRRVRGVLEMMEQHGGAGSRAWKANLVYKGIAAGILYAITGQDNTNPGCQYIITQFKQHGNSFEHLLTSTYPSPTGTFYGFDMRKASEKKHVEGILSDIRYLIQAYSLIRLEPHVQPDYIHFLSQLNIFVDYESGSGHIFTSSKYKSIDINFELVFIRHGQTYGNCGQVTNQGKIDENMVKQNITNHHHRIFQGNVNTSINQLTSYGKQQAQTLAKTLTEKLIDKNWIPDIIYHSPLGRAFETGAPFVDSHHLNDIYCEYPNITEMSFGAWDNRRVCDIPNDNPCHQFYRNQNSLVCESGINGNQQQHIGENFCQVLVRAYHVLMDINQKYANKKVIMFSHSMFGAAICILLGKAQKIVGDHYIAFDGTRPDGTHYTMPTATPFVFNSPHLQS